MRGRNGGVVVRRRLDRELVRRGLVASRTQAQEVIREGRVVVSGGPGLRATRLVAPEEPIHVERPPARFVSRGGEKLTAALDAFAISVAGRRALDAGASTGGFTDCLLQRGVAAVAAVDVGHGQLAWSVRTDPRVTALERTNVRALTAEQLDGPVDLAVADLSFISLTTVAPALVACTTDDADLVLLCKPQFEAGRARVGKGGVVRDPRVHFAVLAEVVDALAERGIVVVDALRSPLRGADGNTEFFLHGRKDGLPVDSAVLAQIAEPMEDQ